MKRFVLQTFLVIGLTLIFGLAGCGVSYFILGPFTGGQAAWWTSLGTPPSGATKFVWGEPKSYEKHILINYVQTNSGKIYRCCAPEINAWEETTPERTMATSNCEWYRQQLTRIRFSNISLENVRDCSVMLWAMEWIADEDFFVILEDGSVWKWHWYSGIDTALISLCGIPLLSIILGWGAIIMARRSRKTRHANL